MSNLAAGKPTHKWKLMVWVILVSMAHRNKIPTAKPMFSRLTLSMAITFMSLGVAVAPEIDMEAENWKQLHLGLHIACK